ncbi:restriction endonuclease subunit S [Spirosoma areae]
MNNSTNKLVPELRFPEFVNEGEWKNDTLINLAANGFSNGVFNDPKKVGSGYRLINVINMYTESTINEDDLSFLKLSQTEFEKNRVEAGDIFFTRSSLVPEGIAKSNIYLGSSECITYDGHLIRMRPKKEVIDPIYLHYLLKSNNVRSQMIAKGKTATMTTIGQSDVASVKISYAISLKEQQKIASFLFSLDELIAAHSQKLDALKEHKKGLMQNLFPQEGENVPKWRFPEFKEDGEWVQTIVEENCLVKGRIGYRGYTTEDLVGQGEGALVLGGKHIQNQLLELKDPTYLSWEKYNESPEIMVEVGDIIFSQRGTLGDCAIIDREIGQATINPSMVLLKNITCDAKFLYYILIGDRIQIEVRKNRAMGAIPMLSQKQIKEFPFLIPTKFKEQQKIASFLSSLDALITAESEKLAQLKLHKKGLMQGLFPKMNV